MELAAADVLLQWATGGLLFLWVTTRRRVVGPGYGWLVRGIHSSLAVLAVVAGRAWSAGGTAALVRDGAAASVAAAALVALAVSVARRREAGGFPPALDLVAPALGAVGVVAAAVGAGGPDALAGARFLAGAAFLGVVTDAMLLGHWYLVQPGLARDALEELNHAVMAVWPVEVAVFLWPTGMVQVLDGTVDDGWGGLLGWVWVVSAVTTISLVVVVRLALKERYYSAVMSATGLLYLAILTGMGTDLVARAVLAP